MEQVRKFENPLSHIVKVAMIVAFVGSGLGLLSNVIYGALLSDPWGHYSVYTFLDVLEFFVDLGLWGSFAIFAMAMSKSQFTTYVPGSYLQIMFILCCCAGGLSMLSDIMPYDASMFFTVPGYLASVGYVVMQVLVYTKISIMLELKSLALWTLILFIVMGANCILCWVPYLNILSDFGVCAAVVFYAIECNKYFGK